MKIYLIIILIEIDLLTQIIKKIYIEIKDIEQNSIQNSNINFRKNYYINHCIFQIIHHLNQIMFLIQDFKIYNYRIIYNKN